MRAKAAMFDLDGTLLDTIEDLADSMNAVLESLGHPSHAIDAYKVFVGDGVEQLVLRALPADRGDEEAVSRALPLFREEYLARWDVKSRPYDGIEEMLAGLAERGIPAAVLSNKLEDLTRKAVERLLAGFEFAVVRGARPGCPKKPDPRAALEIAAEMNISPADFVYVGDTNTDMWTAVSAGMRPIGALWGFREKAELEASGAETVIAVPTDLLDLL